MSNEDDEALARAKLVLNESIKLSATYLNGVAIAVFAVGGLTVPLNGILQGHPATETLMLPVSSFAVSLTLHLTVRLSLRSLR